MFDSIMEMEWANARRSSQPLLLIRLDIDYFKNTTITKATFRATSA
jgi:PleD family two-component response regulator